MTPLPPDKKCDKEAIVSRYPWEYFELLKKHGDQIMTNFLSLLSKEKTMKTPEAELNKDIQEFRTALRQNIQNFENLESVLKKMECRLSQIESKKCPKEEPSLNVPYLHSLEELYCIIDTFNRNNPGFYSGIFHNVFQDQMDCIFHVMVNSKIIFSWTFKNPFFEEVNPPSTRILEEQRDKKLKEGIAAFKMKFLLNGIRNGYENVCPSVGKEFIQKSKIKTLFNQVKHFYTVDPKPYIGIPKALFELEQELNNL